VVWCGVVWCGVVWCGVVWCGVVWYGVVMMHVLGVVIMHVLGVIRSLGRPHAAFASPDPAPPPSLSFLLSPLLSRGVATIFWWWQWYVDLFD
jgi:hypothetical protein